jgi:hypothetical protein
MADYRLYYLAQDNHILRAKDFQSPDDAAAEAVARSRSVGNPVELSSQDRRIGRFEASPAPIGAGGRA